MKKALIFGFNYRGSANELPDCELDAERMASACEKAGFMVQRLVVSTVDNFRQIARSFAANPAEEVLLYYSGHGTSYPVKNDATEPDGTEEALCFWNGRMVELCTDNLFKALCEAIPGKVTVIADCCFSGGMERRNAPPGFVRRTMEVVPPGEFRSLSKIERAAGNETTYLFAAGEDQVSYSTGEGGAFTLQLFSALESGLKTAGQIIERAQGNIKYQTAKLVGDPAREVLQGSAVPPVKKPLVDMREVFKTSPDLKKLPEYLICRIGKALGAAVDEEGFTAAKNAELTFKAIWP